ncbi:ATP-binding protein [bacterium]|nr:ATP-binding protein [bacterium]
MISRTLSACLDGFSGKCVVLEASQQNSLPQIQITGLPNTVVQESRERIKSCLAQLGFQVPTRKLLVHLSPAETKKSGSQFDVAIAMALLTLEGFFPSKKIIKTAFLGELTLSGHFKAINHCIPLLEALLNSAEVEQILIPSENEGDASLFNSPRIYLCDSFQEALQFCFGESAPQKLRQPRESKATPLSPTYHFSLEDLRAQPVAKRALTIALAGRHPLLIEGPPGSGKTHLAHCAASLLPPLTPSETLEVSRIYSFLGESRGNNSFAPFRSPHHSISASAFLGGGHQQVLPGEVSLAHHGILFLDELPEYRRDALEGLREPLQSGEIHLHRISKSICLPAQFHLIAAMNPCRCGYAQSSQHTCICTSEAVTHYRKKISGPLLDRFSLYIWMTSSALNASERDSYDHTTAKTLVQRARDFLKDSCAVSLTPSVQRWLDLLQTKHQMSFRRQKNLIGVARTIAAFEEREAIIETDLEEAWSLRSPETFR